MGIIDHSRVK
ncbi:hypothetical protein XELAEV_180099732mg, partial [Xenopus laevis]